MIIDIIVGAVILISAVISFFRGLIREVLTIAGVVAGVFAAIFWGPVLAPVFYGWLDVDPSADNIEKLFNIVPMNIVADVCAYACVFIIVVIIVSLISHFTAGAAKAMGLGPIDRTLGVIFGIIRAVLLLSLLYLPFYKLMSEDSKTEYFADSKTHYYIEKTAAYISKFLPASDDVKEKATEAADKTIKGKLLQNDFLKDDSKPVKKQPSQPKETGYKDNQRDELEELFEQPIFNE